MENDMESRFILDVVVGKGPAVHELLASEDHPVIELHCLIQSLLIWGNSFLILNLGLDVLNGVGGLNLEGEGLGVGGLNLEGVGHDEDVHLSFSILELLSTKDQPLLC